MPQSRLESTLEMLALESTAPLTQDGNRWRRLPAPLSPDFWQRVRQVTQQRRREQAQMQHYIGLPFGEHMRFLISALDGDPSTAAPLSLPPLPDRPPDDLVAEAETFLRRRSALVITLPTAWPQGMPPPLPSGCSIPAEHRCAEGRALCFWRQRHLGTLVADGKYRDGRFGAELLFACVRMIEEWKPDPPPTWVTCIPSLRHPHLVSDFARRLALRLALPFQPVLRRTAAVPPQKEMQNPVKQATNVLHSLALTVELPPPGPVLLVDDIVDSGWTFAVAGWLLRQAGSGPVYPVALAKAGSDS